MTTDIRHFERGDLGKIDTVHPIDLDRDTYYYDGMEKFGRTLTEDGKPIASWGMEVHWKGNATVWSEFSKRSLDRYPVTVAKNVRRHLEKHIKELRLRRIQSLIYSDDHVSMHWIEWLGFHREARLKNYLGDKDLFIYARLVD